MANRGPVSIINRKEAIVAYKTVFGPGFDGRRIKELDDGSFAAVVILKDKVRAVVSLNNLPEIRPKHRNNNKEASVRVSEVI